MGHANTITQDIFSRPLYLYGSGHLTEDVISFLRRRQIPIAGVIRAPDDAAGRGDGSESSEILRSLSVGDYQRDTAEDQQASILISALDQSDNDDRFLDLLERACAFASHDAAILHPSALLALASETNISGLFALLGFPGSGNRIVQAILTHLYNHHLRPRQHLSNEQQFLRDAARRHTVSVESDIKRRLGHYENFRVRATRGKVNAAQTPIRILQNIRVAFDNGDFAFVKGLHSQGYFGHYFTGHLVPREGLLGFLERMSYRPFIVVRHPLDVIVSCAAKTVRPPQLLIDKDEWFDRTASSLVEALSHTARNRERVHLIRYEELISEPQKVIRDIAQALDVDVDDSEIEAMWDKYGFKSVTPAGDVHLWRPGSGKFREYMRKEHWRKLAGLGMPEAAKALGYDFSEEDFSDRAPMTPEDVGEDDLEVEATDKYFGKEDPTTSHTRRLTGTKIDVTANHEWLAEGVVRALDDAVFRRLDLSTQPQNVVEPG